MTLRDHPGAIDAASVSRFRADVHALTAGHDGPFGVAVSGGADSLALLLLAHAAFPAGVRAISVDHGLRPEAAGECRHVAAICAGLDVPHEAAAVSVRLSGEGVQAAARRARRAAFGDWCRHHRLRWLMTGHHADDQAETVLMRVARGAGVGGLAGIPDTTGLPSSAAPAPADATPALLIRPLLRWRRHDLAALVAEAGLTPVIDPSNADDRFDRTRFRALLATSDLFGADRLAQVASNCRDASSAIAAATHALQRVALCVEDGTATLNVALLHPRHPEIMHRLLRETFARLGAVPDGPSIARLIAALECGRAATLAGLKCVPDGDTWHFAPAPPHRSR